MSNRNISLTLFQFQYTSFFPPLGALYLAYGLEKEGVAFNLKIYPMYKYGTDLDKLSSFFSESEKIIAVGCWSDMLPYVLAALEKVKKKFPDKIVILGGFGPAEVAEEILDKFKFVDFIIKGCGVYLLPRLVKRIISGTGRMHDIDGLVQRRNGSVISNYYTGYGLNMPDLIPYHRIDNIQSYRDFHIVTSFGCPYKCTFCYNRKVSGAKKVIHRDLDKVIEEIKLIREIKKNKEFAVHIDDEAFIINRKRVNAFCNLLKTEKLNVSWSCFGRVDRIDKELLKIMSGSGCKEIYYGIESGSDEILKKIKKGFTIEEAIKILLLSKKYIQTVTASFIYLFPFETPKDFIATKFFLIYLSSKGIATQLHSLCPVKNSEIYLAYKHELFLSNKIKSSCHNKLNDMPGECVKLIKAYPEIFFFHYFYNFKGLNEILEIAKDRRIVKTEYR